MNSDKILIAAPICGIKQYSINYWFEFIALQTYKNYDACLCVNGNGQKEVIKKLKKVRIRGKPLVILSLPSSDLSIIQNITYSREMIRRYAVENKYKGILWLDTDTIPANRDIIKRLLYWKKESVSGLYFYKSSRQPVVIDKHTHTNISIDKLKNAVKNKRLLEIWGSGYGCLLHTKRALEVAFDYELFKENRSDDFGHCEALESKGIKRYLDAFVICKHFSSPEHSKIMKRFIQPFESS